MAENVNPVEQSWFDSEDEELYDVSDIPQHRSKKYGKEVSSFDDLPEPKYSLGLTLGDNNVEPVAVKPKYSKRTIKPLRDFDETPATPEEIKTFNKQAENFIVWHLSQRDLTIFEARQKMFKKQKWPTETIDYVINKCVQHKWLDDVKYVENFVRSEQKWNQSGKYAIKMKLIKKGIPSDLIEEALSEVDSDHERETAKQLLIKNVSKISHLPDDKKTQRLLSLLARKGYPASIAYPLVKEIINNPEIVLEGWE